MTYSSSDTSIATIDNTGLIKGLKAGVVTVTAKDVETSIIKLLM